MTLYEFNQLDELEQLQAVWMLAVELVERMEGTFSYTLFQLEGFYVEIKSNRLHDGGMVGLRSFKTTDLLEPYLGQIVLDELTH